MATKNKNTKTETVKFISLDCSNFVFSALGVEFVDSVLETSDEVVINALRSDAFKGFKIKEVKE